MSYLLDTDTCVAMIRQRPDRVLHRLKQQLPGTVGVSAITIGELCTGAAKSTQPAQNVEALAQFLLPLEVYSFDYGAAQIYGTIRAELERQGTPIGTMDMLIAAHALSLDLIVVTHNTRHFAKVPELRLEDWFELAS
jgi:tRNA(fMet)-specific endonuclease VapC